MSSFNPTSAEIALTAQVFNVADPQKLGIVTGDTAVKVLSGANLSHVVLGEVWAIADKENNGFLTRKGVAVALRLIGYAQKGEPITEVLLDKPGPLAYIDGISQPVTAGSPTLSSFRPVPKSPPSNPSSALPPLTQQDKAKFFKLFIGCGPVSGLLSGEKARDVFLKSKLPNEKLSHIWTLADTKARGGLDSTDFTIGMYLIQASMSSTALALPATLPSWVYDQAVQHADGHATLVNHTTGGGGSTLGSPMQGSFQVPRQYTGSGPASLGSSTMEPQYLGQQFSGTQAQQPPSTVPNAIFAALSSVPSFGSAPAQGQQWDVSAEAKMSADRYFDGLDPQHRGYIEGDVAVPFMLESKLPESELAQIWDLADLHNDGRLTPDGFAVAMHIINSRLAGNEIPSTLPPSLIPPTMRQSQPPVSETANEPQLDLLLDDTPPGSAVRPQATGASAQGRPHAPNVAVSSHNTGQGTFPLLSQSSFQSISQSRQPSAFVPAVNQDLLSDDDEHTNTDTVPYNSAEVGNLQNQIASTTRSLSATQAERTSTEQAVMQQASQLSELQTQLLSAKASYETESRLLITLRDRLAVQRTDIQKTREELIRAESDLSATKVEKAEVEKSVLRDKEEVRDLQQRMRKVGDEMDALKLGIEMAKKNARQQKGLLAIAKKQLATAEAEKAKVDKELEVANKELEILQKEKDDIEAHVTSLETPSISPGSGDPAGVDGVNRPAPPAFAAEIPLPVTPQSTTPQPSAPRQNTNPFARLAMASTGSGSNSPARALSPSEQVETASHPFDFPPVSDLAQPSEGAEGNVGTPRPNVNILTTAGPGSSAPASALASPDTENNAPFLTPTSTVQPLDLDGIYQHHSSKQERPSPIALLSDVQPDGPLKPLQELEIGSDTSDSDNEPLGTRLSTATKAEQTVFDDVSLPTAPDIHPQGLGPTSSLKATFDTSFRATREPTNSLVGTDTSPPTSGKSSPRRSRSPARALSTRTLSSHSIAGVMEPFGAPTFPKTPLEPPAGETAPPPTIETVLEPSAAPTNPSGINDFDEALGKMPSSRRATSPAFKFDSAFDDNFDFSSAIDGNSSPPASLPEPNGSFVKPGHNAGAATTPFFPPVSAPLAPSMPAKSTAGTESAVSGTASFIAPFIYHSSPAASPVNGEPDASFDDVFGLNVAPTTNGQRSTSHGTDIPSDDASGGASKELSARTPPGLPAHPSTPVAAQTQHTPPPVRPASPPRRPGVSLGASRTSSPPPRVPSPRLRAFSGSRPSSENKSEMPSKHKLSIRFPFGRKDKSKDKEDKRAHAQPHLQLPEQQFLSPEPLLPGTVTPAVEDDAEPVKQLAAMGFSRTQSITALESHGYDMQKALNSLLGQPE